MKLILLVRNYRELFIYISACEDRLKTSLMYLINTHYALHVGVIGNEWLRGVWNLCDCNYKVVTCFIIISWYRGHLVIYIAEIMLKLCLKWFWAISIDLVVTRKNEDCILSINKGLLYTGFYCLEINQRSFFTINNPNFFFSNLNNSILATNSILCLL